MLVLRNLYRYTVMLLDIVSKSNELTKTYINDISIGFMIENHMITDSFESPVPYKYKVLLYNGRNNVAIKYYIKTSKIMRTTRIIIFLCEYKIKLSHRMIQVIDNSENSLIYEIYNYSNTITNSDNYSITCYRNNIKKLKV